MSARGAERFTEFCRAFRPMPLMQSRFIDERLSRDKYPRTSSFEPRPILPKNQLPAMDPSAQSTEQLQTLLELEQRHEELLERLDELDRKVAEALEEYRKEWRIPERLP